MSDDLLARIDNVLAACPEPGSHYLDEALTALIGPPGAEAMLS